MKKLLLSALILLCCISQSAAWMSITTVGGGVPAAAPAGVTVEAVSDILSSSYGATPRTISFSAPTSGNTLIVCVYNSNGTNMADTAVTDDQSNTYTLDNTIATDGTDFLMFRSSNVTNAPNTLSISWSGGSSYTFYSRVIEISGLTNSSPVGTSTVSSTGYGTTETATFTPATNNEAAIGIVNRNGDFTVTEGWTRAPASGSIAMGVIHKTDCGDTSEESVTVTFGTAGHSAIGLVTYKKAS